MLLRILLQLFQSPDPAQALAGLLQTLPDFLLVTLPPILLGLTFHEAAHAWTAWKLGDPTARNAGRVSLNPLRHLHPIGTLLMLTIGFGFARPVPIDPEKLRFGRTKGAALVGLAGPLTNILIASAFAIPIRLGLVKFHSPWDYPVPFIFTSPDWVTADILGYFIFFNVILAAFNLIPVAPLDGSRLIGFLLPDRLWSWLARYEVFGFVVAAPLLILVTMLDLFTGSQRLVGIIRPLANIISSLVVGKPIISSTPF